MTTMLPEALAVLPPCKRAKIRRTLEGMGTALSTSIVAAVADVITDSQLTNLSRNLARHELKVVGVKHTLATLRDPVDIASAQRELQHEQAKADELRPVVAAAEEHSAAIVLALAKLGYLVPLGTVAGVRLRVNQEALAA